jgi:uncharacterized protein (DUF302 family)
MAAVLLTDRSPRYAMSRLVPLSFDEAELRVRTELQAEGFGVLTEIDVRATLGRKLGVEVEPYTILGACNPPLAYRAIGVEPDIGLLLPCNVVVRASSHEGETIVEALDPVVQLGISGNTALDDLAQDARDRLTRALDRVSSP